MRKGNMFDMDAADLLCFAQAFVSLGTSVQDQVSELLSGSESDFENLNANAVKLIEERLGGLNEELDVAISAFQCWQTEQDHFFAADMENDRRKDDDDA